MNDSASYSKRPLVIAVDDENSNQSVSHPTGRKRLRVGPPKQATESIQSTPNFEFGLPQNHGLSVSVLLNLNSTKL